MLVISKPELKAEVSFSDLIVFVVRMSARLSVSQFVNFSQIGRAHV